MNGWTRRLKNLVLQSVARHGYDVEKAPGAFPPYRLLKRIALGDDPLADVRRILPHEARCIFDVGAHVGQTAARLADEFPAAQIFSFEPDPRSFPALKEFAARCPRVRPIQAALGDADAQATFFVNRFSQTSSLLRTAAGADQYLVARGGMDSERTETVPVMTLDRFCSEQRIDRIDLLKLDTQGYELRVLDGAQALLRQRAVPLIYLEVNFVHLYEGQPLFPDVYRYLYDRGYRLVWLYERNFHTHYYTVSGNALFVDQEIGRVRA
jgi:FkbM family methyltransferase